jgi:hypothetical protein
MAASAVADATPAAAGAPAPKPPRRLGAKTVAPPGLGAAAGNQGQFDVLVDLKE